jgi:transcriptional regulator with XRE-family HTH domain
MAIHNKVKDLRNEKGWSQKELAEKLDIHPVNMTRLEQGKSMPSVDTLIRLSDIFNVSIDYLLSDEVMQKDSAILKDKELLEAFAKVERMEDKTKELVKEFLDAFIMKKQIGEMMHGKKTSIQDIS